MAGNLLLHCGDGKPYCLDEHINHTCRTTNLFLEWNIFIPPGYEEFEVATFSARDEVGLSRHEDINGGRFIADLSSKVNSSLEANIKFTTKLFLNNSLVSCEDGFTGETKYCSVQLLREYCYYTTCVYICSCELLSLHFLSSLVQYGYSGSQLL